MSDAPRSPPTIVPVPALRRLFALTRTRAFTACLATCLVGTCTFVWIDRQAIRSSIHWRYAAEVLTGNWTPDQPQRPHGSTDKVADGDFISDEEFAAGLVGALVVGYGPYVALIGLLYRIVARRRAVLNLGQAMAVREEVAKGYLVDEFSRVMSPEEASRYVARAFHQMEDRWQSRLQRIIGEEGVKEVVHLMDHEVGGQRT